MANSSPYQSLNCFLTAQITIQNETCCFPLPKIFPIPLFSISLNIITHPILPKSHSEVKYFLNLYFSFCFSLTFDLNYCNEQIGLCLQGCPSHVFPMHKRNLALLKLVSDHVILHCNPSKASQGPQNKGPTPLRNFVPLPDLIHTHYFCLISHSVSPELFA